MKAVKTHSYFIRRNLLQQSSKTRREIYVASVFSLVRSLIIKSEDVADQIHYHDTEQHPQYYGGTTTRENYRYYQHMSGVYTPVDVAMEIYSLDTQTIIPFDQNIKGHVLTYQRLLTTHSYLRNFISKYPTQERLIKGILNPIPALLASRAPDTTILQYNKDFVEHNEYYLIDKIQQFVSTTQHRWKISPYVNLDEYYLGIHEAMVMMSIVPKILSYREDVLGTVQAHSFHVDEYLISNGVNVELSHLNEKQKDFLYRNLLYLKKHAGHSKTFKMMVEGLVKPARIPLSTHVVTHRGNVMGGVEPLFVATNLLPQFRSKGIKEKTLLQYKTLEEGFKAPNENVLFETLTKDILQSRHGKNNTKLLESSLDDSTNRTNVSELQLSLSYLAKLSVNDNLRFTVVTNVGVMKATDVVTYLSILTSLLREETITHTPTAIDVSGIVLNGIITEANFPNTGLDKVHLDYINERIFQPNQYIAKKLFTREIGRLFDVYLDISNYSRSLADARDRVNCINLVNSLFINETIPLQHPNELLDDWFIAKQLDDPRDFDPEDLILTLEDVVLQITELTLSHNLNGERQKATIETLMALSSYSISCAYTNTNADGYALEYSSVRMLDVVFGGGATYDTAILYKPFVTRVMVHDEVLDTTYDAMTLGGMPNDHVTVNSFYSGFTTEIIVGNSTAGYTILTETETPPLVVDDPTTMNSLPQSILNQIINL